MKLFLKRTALLLIMLLCTSLSFSQRGKIQKANKEFDKYSYINARDIYLKVVEDGYQSAEIFKRLGDTYYYNSEYKTASIWYTKLIEEFPEEVAPQYYYRAAQALKSADNYQESDKMMEAFSGKGGKELIIQNFKDNPNYLKSIAEKARAYNLDVVSINTEFSDFGPSFNGDRIVFSSNSNGAEGDKVLEWSGLPYLDLYEADMDAKGNLSNVRLLAGDINTEFNESSATFSKDGNTVYFTRNNFFEGKEGWDDSKTIRLKLYKATKTDGIWRNIEELPFSGIDFSVAHPALSVDEKRLYFASDMTGSLGQSDLWFVDILEDGGYGVPVNLGPTINTEARESFPFISDKNNLYFSSDGRVGLGGLDVFVTSLTEEGKPTGTIKNLGEPTNSGFDDFGFIINEEKRIGFVSSNREGEGGSENDDIYLVQEICEITISGLVTDLDTGVLLPGAEVTLLDGDNKLVDSVIVGQSARYSFVADCDSQYSIRGTKVQYQSKEKIIKTPSETGSIDVPLQLKIIGCPPNDLGCRLTLLPIYFDFDKHNIRPDAEIEIAKILAAMREYSQLVIHIESHTDSRGSDDYNILLSERRAQSTLNWLVEKGIDRSRLSAKGYGETQPINQCTNGARCSEEDHQLNRRSMFIIQN